ncbi:MAG: sortase [Actinomycetota bacterium]
MISLGVLLIGYVAYQLWGTGLYTAAAQNRLDFQLSERLATTAPASLAKPPPVSAADLQPSAPTAVPGPSVIPEAAPAEGEALGRIRIPTAEVDHVMVSGVTREVLRLGPGHMPWTPLPGQPGNAVVSGHRTTYGAPFFHLDRVAVGDEIIVETAIGNHTYQVREILVVDPTDVWVTDPRLGAWLTLTTCTPRYSAAQRLVIAAELVEGPNLAAIEAASPSPPAGAG